MSEFEQDGEQANDSEIGFTTHGRIGRGRAEAAAEAVAEAVAEAAAEGNGERAWHERIARRDATRSKIWGIAALQVAFAWRDGWAIVDGVDDREIPVGTVVSILTSPPGSVAHRLVTERVAALSEWAAFGSSAPESEEKPA